MGVKLIEPVKRDELPADSAYDRRVLSLLKASDIDAVVIEHGYYAVPDYTLNNALKVLKEAGYE